MTVTLNQSLREYIKWQCIGGPWFPCQWPLLGCHYWHICSAAHVLVFTSECVPRPLLSSKRVFLQFYKFRIFILSRFPASYCDTFYLSIILNFWQSPGHCWHFSVLQSAAPGTVASASSEPCLKPSDSCMLKLRSLIILWLWTRVKHFEKLYSFQSHWHNGTTFWKFSIYTLAVP